MQLSVTTTVDVPDEFIRVAEAVMRDRNDPCKVEVMAILAAASPALKRSIALRKAAADMLWDDLSTSTDDQA